MSIGCCIYVRISDLVDDARLIPADDEQSRLVGYTHTVDYGGRWPARSRPDRWWGGLRPLLVTLLTSYEFVWCHSDACYPGDVWDMGHDRVMSREGAVQADFAANRVTSERLSEMDSEWPEENDTYRDTQQVRERLEK